MTISFWVGCAAFVIAFPLQWLVKIPERFIYRMLLAGWAAGISFTFGFEKYRTVPGAHSFLPLCMAACLWAYAYHLEWQIYKIREKINVLRKKQGESDA